MIDTTKWGVAISPKEITASGQLEVVARFVTKVRATEFVKAYRPPYGRFRVLRMDECEECRGRRGHKMDCGRAR
jgi:hypothetical protein